MLYTIKELSKRAVAAIYHCPKMVGERIISEFEIPLALLLEDGKVWYCRLGTISELERKWIAGLAELWKDDAVDSAKRFWRHVKDGDPEYKVAAIPPETAEEILIKGTLIEVL